MKELTSEQKDFLNFVIRSFTLSTTGTYKLKTIIKNNQYRIIYDSEFLNGFRKLYGGVWRTEKSHRGFKYERVE